MKNKTIALNPFAENAAPSPKRQRPVFSRFMDRQAGATDYLKAACLRALQLAPTTQAPDSLAWGDLWASLSAAKRLVGPSLEQCEGKILRALNQHDSDQARGICIGIASACFEIGDDVSQQGEAALIVAKGRHLILESVNDFFEPGGLECFPISQAFVDRLKEDLSWTGLGDILKSIVQRYPDSVFAMDLVVKILVNLERESEERGYGGAVLTQYCYWFLFDLGFPHLKKIMSDVEKALGAPPKLTFHKLKKLLHPKVVGGADLLTTLLKKYLSSEWSKGDISKHVELLVLLPRRNRQEVLDHFRACFAERDFVLQLTALCILERHSFVLMDSFLPFVDKNESQIRLHEGDSLSEFQDLCFLVQKINEDGDARLRTVLPVLLKPLHVLSQIRLFLDLRHIDTVAEFGAEHLLSRFGFDAVWDGLNAHYSGIMSLAKGFAKHLLSVLTNGTVEASKDQIQRLRDLLNK